MSRKPIRLTEVNLDPDDCLERAADEIERLTKALTVSPEKLEACAMALGELHLKNKGYGLAFANDYARAAVIALGLKIQHPPRPEPGEV